MGVFNRMAADYDTLRFVQVCAQRLLELATPPAGARVLDVATGTGIVALVAAEIVGPDGAVVGVDLAPEMLAQARQKLAAAGLTNVTFQQGDAERLDLPDQSFDAVLCASSLFFVPDMRAAVQEWRRVLAPGGYAAFSSFGSSFLQPLQSLWAARLEQYGVPPAALPTLRLADPAACEQLLHEAGFAEVQVRSEQLGYYLSSKQRWAEICAGLEGMALGQLSPAQREQIEAEHLAELDARSTAQGVWVDVAAHISVGRLSAAA
jgi:ubiquinone/menaquinone biosynthesis C-methylase UbiE